MFCPHTIVVNRDGARFADETYFQNMVPSLRHYDVKKHRHTNLPCYLIFDQQYIDGFSFIDAPRGSEVPPWVSRANSIEELASKLKIDAAGLAATVARFNGFARGGADEDFRRGEAAWCLAKKDVWKPTRADETYISPTLGTLRIPPFYGVELHPSVFASGGLVANACAQVINSATYEQVAVWHGKCDPMSFAEEIAKLGAYYNMATIACEIEGPGYAAIGRLVELDYPNIWRTRWADRAQGKVGETMGWSTTMKRKEWAIGWLIKLMVDDDITIHHPATYDEMRIFVRLENGGYGPASEFAHDDCVMAMAIALAARRAVVGELSRGGMLEMASLPVRS
jgi:hypothetical protein